MKTFITISTLLTLLLCANSAFAQETVKPWKTNLELSIVNVNGNSKTSSLSTKGKLSYDWLQSGIEIEAGALNASSQETTTAEQYFASEKITKKLTNKNYIFEKFRWDKDRFADINNRFDLSAGLGRILLDLPAHTLNAELGGGYFWEERIVADKNEFGAGRAFLKYITILGPTANFSQDIEYITNLKEASDSRTKTETALTASVASHISLKTSFVWKHNNKPPEGFVKSNTIFSVAFIVNY